MAQFDELGYIVVSELFDAASIERFLTRFHDLCSGRAQATVSMQKVRDVILAKSGLEAAAKRA